MDHTFLSAFILLLLVLDPLGSLPVFITVMRQVEPQRRRWVALREVGIAFGVLFAFMILGEGFLRVMRLSERSLEVAGGVILLMVAIRMIFSHEGGVYGTPEGKEPLIFPLAVPLLAGPSAMATVLLLASRQPERMWSWVGALACALPWLGMQLGHRCAARRTASANDRRSASNATELQTLHICHNAVNEIVDISGSAVSIVSPSMSSWGCGGVGIQCGMGGIGRKLAENWRFRSFTASDPCPIINV